MASKFDECVVVCMDECVVACLDKKNKDDFDVDIKILDNCFKTFLLIYP